MPLHKRVLLLCTGIVSTREVTLWHARAVAAGKSLQLLAGWLPPLVQALNCQSGGAGGSVGDDWGGRRRVAQVRWKYQQQRYKQQGRQAGACIVHKHGNLLQNEFMYLRLGHDHRYSYHR